MNPIRAVAAALFLLHPSCTPTIQQSAEKQTYANELHGALMEKANKYTSEPGIKVLAACMDWKDGKIAGLSSPVYYHFETEIAGQGRTIQNLETDALLACERSNQIEQKDCTCQTIDRNGKNAIVVP